jgi:hypothetical protein
MKKISGKFGNPFARKRLVLHSETISVLTAVQLRGLAGGDPKTLQSAPELCHTSESGSSTQPTENCTTRNTDCPSLVTACC